MGDCQLMSLSHLIILGIVILIVVPPEKLPELMRNLGRMISDFKRQTNGLFSEVKDEFRDVKKDITSDIKLTPEDMLKKLSDKDKPVEKDKPQNSNEST